MPGQANDATEWLATTFLRLSDAHSLATVEAIVGGAVRDRPEFEEALLAEARRTAAGTDRELVHRACGVLAVLGDATDVRQVEEISRSKDAWLAGAARLALFMIGSRTT